jgi:hypothetical protein
MAFTLEAWAFKEDLGSEPRSATCCALSRAKRVLVVGAMRWRPTGARSTGDLDIWVRPTPANAERVWKALAQFGAPIRTLTLET